MDITDIIARGDGGRNLRSSRSSSASTKPRPAPRSISWCRRSKPASGARRPRLTGCRTFAALAKGNHARYLDGDDAGIVDDGNAILGHIFGSKDVSRGVAAHAAAETGIGDGILKQMLPMITAMVMGGLSKKVGADTSGDSGGIGDILGQVLGGGGPASAGAGPSGGGSGGHGDILGQVLSGAGGAESDARRRRRRTG